MTSAPSAPNHRNLAEFLDDVERLGWTWFYKRITPNEAGVTGAHQRALVIPRPIARTLFAHLMDGVNPSESLPFDLVSHDLACGAARVTHWNQGTRDEYHITNLGGAPNPLLTSASNGRLFILALPPSGLNDPAKAWLVTRDEEHKLRARLGRSLTSHAGVHRPGGGDHAPAVRQELPNISRRMETLRTVGEEITEPDPSGTAEAFSQSGYKFELAIADLIDNSIDAAASSVLIRFITDSSSIQRIVVADDGSGMSETQLRTAMQYGARIKRHVGDLGKYGVGMKSASLSQCRSLSVLTRQAGVSAARRWTEQSIKSGWRCEVLDPDEAGRMLDRHWGVVEIKDSGTLIVWDGLDRLRSERDGVERSVEGLFKLLNLHLGLVFHRFIASRRLRIHIDRVDADTWDAGLPTTVEPLDPFAYPATGARGYPKTFDPDLGDGLNIELRAHIWPPKSKLPGYRLGGGRIASRQGFYFYRNDRLVQAGGWNGWRDNDSEPHLSLARAAVDLPETADRAFGLSLHKSFIDVPSTFAASLDRAQSTDGPSLRDYIVAANDAYRSGTAQPTDRDSAAVPGPGISRRLAARSRHILAGADPNVRPFRFTWVDLPDDVVVDVDREMDTIRLNGRYRRTILDGRRASANDAPLTKVLLFLALRGHLGRERSSGPLRKELTMTNELLRATLTAIEADE